jgi:hypothetical protein
MSRKPKIKRQRIMKSRRDWDMAVVLTSEMLPGEPGTPSLKVTWSDKAKQAVQPLDGVEQR